MNPKTEEQGPDRSQNYEAYNRLIQEGSSNISKNLQRSNPRAAKLANMIHELRNIPGTLKSLPGRASAKIRNLTSSKTGHKGKSTLHSEASVQQEKAFNRGERLREVKQHLNQNGRVVLNTPDITQEEYEGQLNQQLKNCPVGGFVISQTLGGYQFFMHLKVNDQFADKMEIIFPDMDALKDWSPDEIAQTVIESTHDELAQIATSTNERLNTLKNANIPTASNEESAKAMIEKEKLGAFCAFPKGNGKIALVVKRGESETKKGIYSIRILQGEGKDLIRHTNHIKNEFKSQIRNNETIIKNRKFKTENEQAFFPKEMALEKCKSLINEGDFVAYVGKNGRANVLIKLGGQTELVRFSSTSDWREGLTEFTRIMNAYNAIPREPGIFLGEFHALEEGQSKVFVETDDLELKMQKLRGGEFIETTLKFNTQEELQEAIEKFHRQN